MKNPVSFLLVIAALLFLLIMVGYLSHTEPTDEFELLKSQFQEKHISSVDHSKFAVLQQKFNSPQDVTRACVSCHTERHKELLKSPHWKWERESFIQGRGVVNAGKKNLINNFCIGIGGSEQGCTRCHGGYGWTDDSFDFSKWENIDCLVCHDNSAEYIKEAGKAGYPAADVNLAAAAQNVGLPKTWNCGGCHFFSGGGNNVKHGDLEMALLETTRDVDVHMAGGDGPKMQCVDCHETKNHKMLGKLYSVSSNNRDRLYCDRCHGSTPHEDNILNEHTVKVACQTCHIPEYAKVNATKMFWDWSTAGKLKDGEPYHETDENGNETYMSIKGSFKWEKNVKPEYTWFNGNADHYLLGDKVDTTKVIPMNTLFGEYRDPDSKIIPIKIHRAKQIYDCQNQTIIQPKLFAEKKGQGAYWKDFDWQTASTAGMAAVHAPYSGHYCFVNTEMSWPLNHMVSPSDKAVSCTECHTRENGRLAALQDFYMPGRNYSAFIDGAGKIMIILSLLGIIIHASLRIFAHYARKGGRK